MTDVWVLSEGVPIEGMEIAGAFSSWALAISYAAGIMAHPHPPDFELQLDWLKMNEAPYSRPCYHLQHPWEEWT